MTTKNYRMLRIVYPGCEESYSPIYAKDSSEFPQFKDYIEDQAIEIVLDVETGDWHDAHEFFYTANVTSFTAEIADDSDPNFIMPEE